MHSVLQCNCNTVRKTHFAKNQLGSDFCDDFPYYQRIVEIDIVSKSRFRVTVVVDRLWAKIITKCGFRVVIGIANRCMTTPNRLPPLASSSTGTGTSGTSTSTSYSYWYHSPHTYIDLGYHPAMQFFTPAVQHMSTMFIFQVSMPLLIHEDSGTFFSHYRTNATPFYSVQTLG
jgi:hypothetical protein